MQSLFPYTNVRQSQDRLIEFIYSSLENKKNAIIHAPTGLGKTVAALSPALSFALKNNLTLIFVTPKHTQHEIAIETLNEIKTKHNAEFGVVDFIGKRHMCAQQGAEDMPNSAFYDYCKNHIKNKTCNFYNNIKKDEKHSLETDLLIKELSGKAVHVQEVKGRAKDSKLCPFEISCIIGKKARVIIADYNHVLNPAIRDNLLDRLNKEFGKCIIIIDEAHNLPDKCRDLMSAQLSSATLDFAVKECIEFKFDDVAEVLSSVKNALEFHFSGKFGGSEEVLIKKAELNNVIMKIIDSEQLSSDLFFVAEAVLQDNKTENKKERKKSFCEVVANFLLSWQGSDEGFTRFVNKSFSFKKKLIITFNYKCLDPSLILRPLSQQCYSVICMSGTLTPVDMYKDLFGFDALTAEFSNPFPKENKMNIIIPDTTTKYAARSNEMFEKIASYCSSIANYVPGNSILFFPSYDLRDKVNLYFQNKCEKTTFLETSNLTKHEKSELIEKFKSYKSNGAVLLAASSGNFGEGIDIEDNILKCVIVVGIPLDKPDLETQELIAYYDKKFNKGWDYGYIMPAIIKCLQNAGRCIRSESDRGVIIFLDQRYIWENYFKCFPKDYNLRITKEPLNIIKNFFTKE